MAKNVKEVKTGLEASDNQKTQKEFKTIENLARKNNKTDGKPQNLLRYTGMILLMIAFLLIVPIASQGGEEFLLENIIMTLLVALGIILATLGYYTITIIVGAASVVGFAAYKMYMMLVLNEDFYYVSYLWVLIPIMSTLGIGMFLNGYSKLGLDNALLKQQVSELVMIDSLTGLYNLRSMYMDIQTQISYSERNNSPISLMIIRLRYPEEMKKVLKEDEYETVIKQMALLLVDTVRLEDKVYCIDRDNGGFAILLTCDRDGIRTVDRRFRKKFEDPSWFSNVSNKHQVRAEVRIGSLPYEADKYKRDAHSFKECVEEEVKYDI